MLNVQLLKEKCVQYIMTFLYVFLQMKYILGALVALLVASKTFAQTGNTAADYGIQAGTELAQAIANRDLESTMGKLATKVGPYLEIAGTVIGTLFSTL